MSVVDQQHAALRMANDSRLRMAQVKHNVAELSSEGGRELVAVLLEHPSGVVPSMRVGVLVGAIRQVGRSRAGRWLASAGIRSGDRRIDELSERQRVALSAELRKKGRRR